MTVRMIGAGPALSYLTPPRSAAVAERLGFTKEGVLRQSEMRNGRLHDFSIYGLLAAEWQNHE